MHKNDKSLILLTDNYPLSDGEFFLDDEIVYLAGRFRKIFVIVAGRRNGTVKRVIPPNVEVVQYQPEINTIDKVKNISALWHLSFWQELRFVLAKLEKTDLFAAFKIMFMDWLKARKLKKYLNAFTRLKGTDGVDFVFYSYWHDYKAFALAMMKNADPERKCIARAHGWDVFACRHRVPYLPFKKYILKNLNYTYSISQAGQHVLINEYLPGDKAKVRISRLGKSNHDLPNNNMTQKYLICSCSNLVPVKRVHLIADVVSHLQDIGVTWVHFGDGPLKNEITEYAGAKLPQDRFDFKGVVLNPEILDYYHENSIDLFINLSESEGIPVSIMEALSAGIPVLATHVGGTSEIVNNRNGFLVEKDTGAEEIAVIIRNYLLSPDEQKLHYRHNAYDFWKENYNAERNYACFADEILTI